MLGLRCGVWPDGTFLLGTKKRNALGYVGKNIRRKTGGKNVYRKGLKQQISTHQVPEPSSTLENTHLNRQCKPNFVDFITNLI